MGTAKKAKYPIGFYICCITYTFERFAFYGTKPLLALFLAASVAEGGIGVTKAQAGEIAVWLTSLTYITPIIGGWLSDRFLGARYAVTLGCIIMGLGLFLRMAGTQRTYGMGNDFSRIYRYCILQGKPCCYYRTSV